MGCRREHEENLWGIADNVLFLDLNGSFKGVFSL